MQEIKITLETLYDILRNEKKREDLQKLNETFFYDIVNYLKEKKTLLESKKKEDDLFAAGEREKLEYELTSIRRILKETYEKREKKIIDIALNRSRTKSDIIDTSSMLREEKDFYSQLVFLLDGYRDGILLSLFKGELPFFKKPDIHLPFSGENKTPLVNIQKEELALNQNPQEKNPSFNLKDETLLIKKETENPRGSDLPAPNPPENPLPKNPLGPQLKKIRFLHAVPSFVWKDLKEYGPFEAGEETEIFPEIADLIVEKGRAVFVERMVDTTNK